MKAIYTELDEEVTSIIERIRKLRDKNINIIIPQRAIIFGSSTNLKLLNREAEKLNKSISITTQDPHGKKLCEKLNIKLETSTQKKTSSKFTKTTFATTKPSRKTKTIANILAAESKTITRAAHKAEILITSIPSRRMLAFFVATSIFLLMFIAYIALPSANITITPRTRELTHVANITIIDTSKFTGNAADLLDHELLAERITITNTTKSTQPSTGKEFKGESAHGEIKIYNRTAKPKHFVPSRFQTDNGLIFRTTHSVVVPPRQSAETPGSVTAYVIADIRDTNGEFIGDRGNIDKGKFFTMPAIPFLSPLYYYAENKKPFTNGVTKIVSKILATDIETAKQKTLDLAITRAKKDLRNNLRERNIVNNTNLKLLEDKQAIDITPIKTVIDPSLVGQLDTNIPASAIVRVSGLAYDQDRLIRTIVKDLQKRIHPAMRLIRIDPARIQTRLLEKRPNSMKFEVTLIGIQSFDLRKDTTAGKTIRAKIQKKIAGLTIPEALAILRNMDEVRNVEIQNFPLWSNTLPGIADNIKVHVKE